MNKWIFKYLSPSYDETATFLMAIAFVFIYVADAGVREGLAGTLEFSNIPRQNSFIVMFSLIFIAGFLLSIYHVFSKRKKESIEKILMLVFAMTMNGIAAITSGMYLLKTEAGLLRIFTLWNILNGVILLYQMGFIEEGFFLGEDSKLCQTCVGLVAILILFYLCYFMFHLYWAVTFSICVCYATIISRFVNLKISSLIDSRKR